MKALRAINNLFASASMMLAMSIIFIMVAALFLSATTRFITGTGFAWFLELPPVLVSWLVFPLLGPLLKKGQHINCLLYTSPSPRDGLLSRMPSSA